MSFKNKKAFVLNKGSFGKTLMTRFYPLHKHM